MQLRGDRLEQPELGQRPKSLFRRAGAQNLVVLLQQPRRRALGDLVPVRPDRGEDQRIDAEVEACGERHRAQHSHRVLAQPDFRIANRPDDPGLEIFESADVVDDREIRDVVDQGVDGEVAAKGVLFGRAECVVVMNQVLALRRRRIGRGNAVLHDLFARCDLAAKRSDLDDLGAELDVRQSEPAADDPAVAEELLDLIRVRRCPDVEIFGTAPEQQIAHTAANQVGNVIVLPQSIEDLERVGIDVAPRERMLGARNDPRGGHRRIVPKG